MAKKLHRNEKFAYVPILLWTIFSCALVTPGKVSLAGTAFQDRGAEPPRNHDPLANFRSVESNLPPVPAAQQPRQLNVSQATELGQAKNQAEDASIIRLPAVSHEFEPLPKLNASNEPSQWQSQFRDASPSTDRHGHLDPESGMPPQRTSILPSGNRNPWLEPYEQRALSTQEHGPINGTQDAASIVSGIRIEPNFVPWWDREVRGTTNPNQQLPVVLEGLIQAAIVHSPYVQALTSEPRIQEALIIEEAAKFDWTAFVESNFEDTNEPIGSTLTTGNGDRRFKDHQWNMDSGLRKRNGNGSEVELNQVLGRQSNNSTFLNPNPQTTSKFELRYVHPLLRGRGTKYNRSQVRLAEIALEASQDEVAEELPKHIVEVSEAYWDLYAARAQLAQRHNLLREAILVLENLKGRQEVDVLQRQVLRVEATIAKRRSEIARAENGVRNSETRLRLLVNDPELVANRSLSFVPIDAPVNDLPEIPLSDSLTTALKNRGEIAKSLQQINAASVRYDVARNDLLPNLDLILNTRVNGLDGDEELMRAYGNQFSEGRPSYTAGLRFEVPLGNRASKAKRDRREWELFRIIKEFENTVEQTMAEVEISVRELETSRLELLGKYASMISATEEVNYLADRWKSLPRADDSATLLLEDLLESQERLADQESEFVSAQIGYAMALIRTYQSMGILLQMSEAGQ